MGQLPDLGSREHLTTTDAGIVKTRQHLTRAAQALREKGVAPPGTDPAAHRARSAAIVLPAGQKFHQAAREASTVRPGVALVSV